MKTQALSIKPWRRWLRQIRLAVDRSPTFFWLRRLRAFNARVLFGPDIYGFYGSVHLVYLKYREESDRKESDRNDFLSSAWAALALIEHNDPAAWRMVEREIKYLVNFYLSSVGNYKRNQRSCCVDYERNFTKGEPITPHVREWYIAALAATIVHEATHGRIFSLGIPYHKATRERVERLCVLRERRFIARLHSDHYDLMAIAPPFDAQEWNSYWERGMRSQEAKELWKCFRRDVKQAKK